MIVIRVPAEPHSCAKRDSSLQKWSVPHRSQLLEATGRELRSSEAVLVKLLFYLVRNLNPPSSQ